LKTNLDVLSFSNSGFIEKNMEILNDSIDELSNEQSKFQKYQKASAVQQAQQQAWLQKRVDLFILYIFLLCVLSLNLYFFRKLKMHRER
jgi:hypothetical protein